MDHAVCSRWHIGMQQAVLPRANQKAYVPWRPSPGCRPGLSRRWMMVCREPPQGNAPCGATPGGTLHGLPSVAGPGGDSSYIASPTRGTQQQEQIPRRSSTTVYAAVRPAGRYHRAAGEPLRRLAGHRWRAASEWRDRADQWAFCPGRLHAGNALTVVPRRGAGDVFELVHDRSGDDRGKVIGSEASRRAKISQEASRKHRVARRARCASQPGVANSRYRRSREGQLEERLVVGPISEPVKKHARSVAVLAQRPFGETHGYRRATRPYPPSTSR